MIPKGSPQRSPECKKGSNKALNYLDKDPEAVLQISKLKIATSNPAQNSRATNDSGATNKRKKLTTQRQGHVIKLFKNYGFIQPSTLLPSLVKAKTVYFSTSIVEGPAVKSGTFVSFTLNCRFPDRPFAISVKMIPKDSPQRSPEKNVKYPHEPSPVSVKKTPKDSVPGSSEKKALTLSDLDGLLYANVISVSGKSGFMKHTHELPPPYNHNKIVQFLTPDGMSDKSLTKGQQAVFTLDKDSQKKLVAKDVFFVHASYDPTTTILYVGDFCDHICLRDKDDTESVISCWKDCSRKLICSHACPKKCFEKCPEECKQCSIKNKGRKEKCNDFCVVREASSSYLKKNC